MSHSWRSLADNRVAVDIDADGGSPTLLGHDDFTVIVPLALPLTAFDRASDDVFPELRLGLCSAQLAAAAAGRAKGKSYEHQRPLLHMISMASPNE